MWIYIELGIIIFLTEELIWPHNKCFQAVQVQLKQLSNVENNTEYYKI